MKSSVSGVVLRPRGGASGFMLKAIKNIFSGAGREPPPLCFVVAEDAGKREEIGKLVGSLGLRVEPFSDVTTMLRALTAQGAAARGARAQPPDLTFFDLALGC